VFRRDVHHALLEAKIAMSEDYPYLSCHLPPKLYEFFCDWKEKHKYSSDSEALIAMLVQFLISGSDQASKPLAQQSINARSPDPSGSTDANIFQEVRELAKKSIAWTTN
jgi:Arc/MetJ-type ribon-helix-helix transcriptional regulator